MYHTVVCACADFLLRFFSSFQAWHTAKRKPKK
jgi:hypothetical protein